MKKADSKHRENLEQVMVIMKERLIDLRVRSHRALIHGGRILAVLAVAGGSVVALCTWRFAEMRYELIHEMARTHFRADRLAMTADFDSARQRLVETIAHEMRHARSDEALDTLPLAQLIVQAAEKYPFVDPLLFASIGIVDYAHSRSNEGLHRVDPEAARLLAEELGWAYDDALSADAERSADLAARHLGQLQEAYNDVELVLAEYKGGPLDAAYLRARVSKLPSETKSYVADVLKTHHRLAARLTAEPSDALESDRRTTHHQWSSSSGSHQASLRKDAYHQQRD